MKARLWSAMVLLLGVGTLPLKPARADDPPSAEKGIRRYLYVAVPGIRDYLEYGGHGLLVFDIDHGHKVVKRIYTAGRDPQGKPLNVKGICANAETQKVYISTIRQLMCIDLVTEQLEWERAYPEGCDRMAISPNGQVIYLPSLEGKVWNVVNASNGFVQKQIEPNSGAHNTVFGPNGKEVYLAGLKSPLLTVVDAHTQEVLRTVGPFSASIRPFTINGRQTLCFVNVNDLLGFEVGDLTTGKKLARVEVEGFTKGPTKRHGCPSHGIGLTPDEKELWVTDAANSRVHIFDATVMPPKQQASIVLKDQPGWITFSIDGRFAYPSTGDVIDTRTRKIVAELKDETGQAVQSEKMLEIDFEKRLVRGLILKFEGDFPIGVGDQFGIGRRTEPVPD